MSQPTFIAKCGNFYCPIWIKCEHVTVADFLNIECLVCCRKCECPSGCFNNFKVIIRNDHDKIRKAD